MSFEHYSNDKPFNFDKWIAAMPADALARGMFFNTLQKTLKFHGKDALDKKWIGFKQYPRVEYFEAMREVGERVKDRTLADGLFKAGRFVYPDFSRSLVGKSIFAVAGSSFLDMVRLAPRGYAAANLYGEATIEVANGNCVQLRLENVWDPTPYSAGILQGVFDLFHIEPLNFEFEERAPGHVSFRLGY